MTSVTRRHVPLLVTETGRGTFRMAWEHGPLLDFDNEGRVARVVADAQCPLARADLIRWGAPLSLACQGHVLLHASAFATSDGCVTLVGVGGAGKSTLANELAIRGRAVVADDMLLCDAQGRSHPHAEPTLRAWCVETARRWPSTEQVHYADLATALSRIGDAGWRPIRAVVFLNETRADDVAFRFDDVAGAAVFQRLVAYGFAGVPVACAWEHRFRAYSALASGVPCTIATAPQGLDRLRVALPSFERELETRAARSLGSATQVQRGR